MRRIPKRDSNRSCYYSPFRRTRSARNENESRIAERNRSIESSQPCSHRSRAPCWSRLRCGLGSHSAGRTDSFPSVSGGADLSRDRADRPTASHTDPRALEMTCAKTKEGANERPPNLLNLVDASRLSIVHSICKAVEQPVQVCGVCSLGGRTPAQQLPQPLPGRVRALVSWFSAAPARTALQ